MQHVYAVQNQPICDTYSVTPLHMRHVQCKTAPYATCTVQYQPICDTYSALTPIHAIWDTYICGMHGGELFNDVQNEQATHLVSSSSIHGSVLLRNTSQSSFRFTFISRGSKLAVVPGPSLSRAPCKQRFHVSTYSYQW